MRKCVTTHAILAALLACYVTADVSAQILFAGDNNGLSVNGKELTLTIYTKVYLM